MESGTLYVVATPIGNLEDITARALRILREVAVIAAEDTRHTRKLCTHFGIGTRMISYHGHNETRRAQELLALLQRGESVALVSDAGTPGIADPGYRIIRAARDAGIPVVPVPGPSAIITALCAAGLPTTRFTFVGFLPEKSGRRATCIAELAPLPHTLVFYVARWDLAKYLAELQAGLGDRTAVVCRELTKQFEEFKSGRLSELTVWAEAKKIKGEMTVVVQGSE